ncbi:MAG TPA: tetratricopeptide repeat protein [Alphaproteobacteria bacterium]|nr:tetratricopeptide repeat protein [Alphaproteobacteria bacterium]
MSDIFREVDEDVRAQEYLRLWKTYGKYVIAGMVAIVVGTAGSVAWRNYQSTKLKAEGDKYAAAMDQFNDGDYAASAKAFEKIAGQASGGYKVVASLQEAEADLKAGKKDDAVKLYNEIAASSSYDKVYRDLASLSVAMQTINTADPEKLLSRLDAINTEENPWRHSAQELLAALALRTGDKQTAENLFKALADDSTASSGIRSRARTMLAAMGSKS